MFMRKFMFDLTEGSAGAADLVFKFMRRGMEAHIGQPDMEPVLLVVRKSGAAYLCGVGHWFCDSNTKTGFADALCAGIDLANRLGDPLVVVSLLAEYAARFVPPGDAEGDPEEVDQQDVMMLTVETPERCRVELFKVLRDGEGVITELTAEELGTLGARSAGRLLNLFQKADARAHGVSVENYLEAEKTLH